ncbi:MAG TPA: PilZ domain-containing protein [Myxococcota bacterium]
MGNYERFALVIDAENVALGGIAVRLLDLGIDLLYAADLNEGILLAAQESQRLGAVLIPSSFAAERIDALVSRVCTKLAAGPRALIIAGLDREAGFVERLREHGVQWAVSEPYEERELRFVLTAAMSTGHTGERRKHPRIPTDIETAVFMGRHRKEVVVHDLSMSGAYLATAHPFLEGSKIALEIPLPDGSVLGNATVVNSKSAEKPGRADVPEGMGVCFSNLSAGSAERLQAFIAAWIDRFRL